MHMRKQTLVLATALAFAAAPALYANDSHESSGSARKDGMMSRSSQMMDGCGAMMQGRRGAAVGRMTGGAKTRRLSWTATVEHGCRRLSVRVERFLVQPPEIAIGKI